MAHDTDGTIREAKRLFVSLGRPPNVMIKVPATLEGMPAIRNLIGEGINVNVTLIFSLDMYRHVMEAYIGGIEDLIKNGGDAGKVASVASFFLSRIDTVVDTSLEERIRQGQEQLRDLLGKAAVANAKLAYHAFKQTFDSERFEVLRAKGGSSTTSIMGKHWHEKSGLQRRYVRGAPHWARYSEHYAAGDHKGIPGPRSRCGYRWDRFF